MVLPTFRAAELLVARGNFYSRHYFYLRTRGAKMNHEHIKLANRAIFKLRHNQWYLIDTKKGSEERFLVGDDSKKVLSFLFRGESITETCREFGISDKELHDFIGILERERVVSFTDKPQDSSARCYDTDPPLDSINTLITNACNLRCAHCYVGSGEATADELDGKEWIKILKQALQLGAFGVNVSGGEPLLHRDFREIAEFIASVPTFNANLNTNGTQIKVGQEELLSRAFTTVQISIDDSIGERHDAFRGSKGCFKKSVKAIEKLVAYGVEVNVGFSLTPHSLSALDGVVEFCENIGVSALGIGLVANNGRASINNLAPSVGPRSMYQDEFMALMYRKLRELSERNTTLRILPPFRISDSKVVPLQEKQYICNGDNSQVIYVMADGTGMPCDKLPPHAFGCGNLKRQSLIDVWMSDKMTAFKRMSIRQLPKCRECPHLKICGGACVARSFQTGGLLESPDWTACVIAQKIAAEQ